LEAGDEIIIKHYIDSAEKGGKYGYRFAYNTYMEVILYEVNSGMGLNFIPAADVELVAACDGSIFSNSALDQIYQSVRGPHACSCDMTDLLRYGCRCGGI
jgi:hypothetical protein